MARLLKGAKSHLAVARSLLLSLPRATLPSRRHFAYLKRILSARELLLIRICGVVILLNVAFLTWHAWTVNTIKRPAVSGVLKEGLIGNVRTLNPILASEKNELDLIALLYSSLFRYDPQGSYSFKNDLVDHYQISDNGRTYTLFLRDNVVFSNGKPLTSEDILFTINTIKDPAYKSPLFTTLKDVGISTPNPLTVVLTLPEPYAPFLSTLTFGILPAHIFAPLGPAKFSNSEYNTHPVGSGPFIFSRLQKDKEGTIVSIELLRNAHYFAQRAYLKGVTILFFASRDELIDALTNKKIDAMAFVGDTGWDVPTALLQRLHIVSPSFSQYTALFLNATKNPWLKELKVRQALSLSFDPSEILKGVFPPDMVIPLTTPWLPGITASPEEAPLPKGDRITQAQRLIQEVIEQHTPKPAKAKKGQKTPAEPAPPVIRISLTSSSSEPFLTVSGRIKEAWERLGLTVELISVDGMKLKRENIKSRDYEVILTSLKEGIDPDPFPFWHSSQIETPGLNIAQFSHKGADTLLTEARIGGTPQQRSAAYQKFTEILKQELPAIFLWAPRYVYMLDQRIQGVSLTHIAVPSDRFADIAGWYMDTKRSW